MSETVEGRDGEADRGDAWELALMAHELAISVSAVQPSADRSRDAEQTRIALRALSLPSQAASTEMRACLASALAVVRIQNGNKHNDINALLAMGDKLLADPPANPTHVQS